MKLAILADGYLMDKTAPINGSLVQLYNLSHGFKENDIEVHYIAATKDRSKPDYEQSNDIHFHWIQKKDGFLQWKPLMKHYDSLLNKLSPDVVYVRGRNVMQYVAGKYASKHYKTCVWGTNGDDSAEFWKNVKRLKRSKKSSIKKLVLYPFMALEDIYINKGMKMADYVVNQNLFQKENTAKLLNKEGIVINSYYFLEESIEKVHKNSVLWLARWAPEKQPKLFLEIASNSKHDHIDFVMAGDSSDAKVRVEILNRAKDNMKFPGKISYNEVNDYFSKALIFVNTSYKEGMSNTFIEAMLHGVPVLSLNSNPNNWLTDYNIGYCANGNIKKLTQKLDELLSDRVQLQDMCADAKRFAKREFSNNKIIKSYIELFNANE